MRMERNKEIGTSESLADSLTEEQCDVLEWASNMRHTMHSDIEALYDVKAPNHKAIKAFISDSYHSQDANNLNKRLSEVGLPAIVWTFDDKDVPTNELATILDNRRLEKILRRKCLKIMEQANADIENYFAEIDEKYLTFYCPTGSKRGFYHYGKQMLVASKNATIKDGYVIVGTEKLKDNIAYMLQVHPEQISVEDIVEYVNGDLESRLYHMDSSMAPKTGKKVTNVLVETGYVKPSTNEMIYISLTKKGDTFAGNFCGTLDKIAASLSMIAANRAHKNDIVYYSHLIEQAAARKEITPLVPKSVDFITNKLKEKKDLMLASENNHVTGADTFTHYMNINGLPVVYKAKFNTYVIAELTTLLGKINVSIINSLFVGTAYTITVQQYEFVTIYYPGDEIDWGRMPQEVQEQLKVVIPKLINIIQTEN